MQMRLCNHNKIFECDFSHMKLIKKHRKGMAKFFTKTPNTNRESMEINDARARVSPRSETLPPVWKFTCMAKETCQSSHNNLSAVIKEVSWQKMQAEEKAALAIQAGEVGDGGIPVIAVVTDGAWSRRSYRTNYNVLSGARIIGAKTKVLFASTRNSYCYICDRASSIKANQQIPMCYKNWNKSSTTMAADIIVEGFRNSIAIHNLKYNKL
ncbi:hypothetical protein PR048_021355, partial [Dryococelus australis]